MERPNEAIRTASNTLPFILLSIFQSQVADFKDYLRMTIFTPRPTYLMVFRRFLTSFLVTFSKSTTHLSDQVCMI